jgi:hypothetical protein
MTRKHESIHIETFELSPHNEAVISTLGRLRRQFPGPCFSLAQRTFDEPDLRNTIAQTLAKMSHQSAPGTRQKVWIAGHEHDEDRDTIDPKMVTGLFTAFVRPLCVVVESLRIHKNTREEVLWLDSRLPWRRSGLWLLIRVALQLGFRRLCPSAVESQDIYKHFIIYYMSMILNDCSRDMSDEHRYIMTAKIGRRLRKLELTHRPGWLPYVQQSLCTASDVIKESWRGVITRNSPQHDLPGLANLDFMKDIDCVLPDLNRWLDGIVQRKHLTEPASFQPLSKLANFRHASILATPITRSTIFLLSRIGLAIT